jgi:hypothetical protein
MWSILKKKRRSGPSVITAVIGIAVAGMAIFFVRNLGNDVLRYVRIHRM